MKTEVFWLSKIDTWLPKRLNVESGKTRLFCFPWAGGSASFYYRNYMYLPNDIEICPIQIPGRETRYNELLYTNVDDLVEDIINDLQDFFSEKDFAFLGHSMGGGIAFELAHQLLARGLKLPEHIFLSACTPSIETRKSRNIPIESLLMINGTPKEVIENTELRDIYIPILEADLKLVDSIKLKPNREKLPVPITVMGGESDELISKNELMLWKNETNTDIEIYQFNGGHLYIKESLKSVMKVIDGTLKRVGGGLYS